jgi:transposase
MKTKSVPPRVEYVLEAQALKEARDDPRWSRSSPEILLHDGAGSKRENRTGRAGDEREAGAAQVFSAFRGQPVQVAVEACGFWPGFREVVEPEVKRLVLVHPQRVKAIASAKLKNDRVDSETLAHLLRCDLLPESWKADRETQARRQRVRLRATLVRQGTRLKNQVHAVLHQQAAFSGDGFIRQARTAVAGWGEAAGAGAGVGERVLAVVGRLPGRNSKTKPSTK